MYPMVVMKLVVKDPSEKRSRMQLLPTPANMNKTIRSKDNFTIYVSLIDRCNRVSKNFKDHHCFILYKSVKR